MIISVKNVGIESVKHKVIFGEYCPKCKTDGGLFHYDNKYSSYSAVYICENCNSRFSDEEYKRLVNNELRKQKLEKINETEI